MIGTTISHYRILEELGRGGMGIVYKAHDTKLERDVALKFLPAHLSASEQDKARFMQEAKAAATLDHPNICTIHSIEEHEGQLFIAMQFVDGQLLRDRMSGLTEKQAIEIGIQVADGLAAAHEKGIVHRDIKPENIMVRKDGIVQIMDFGLAKLKGVSRLTKEGSTVGTAGYMSPEQVQGQDADHRSDIFSLGVLLYEMLVGQLPFKGIHETAIAYEIVNVDALPMSAVKSSIVPDLDSIVLECLEKDPNERAQSARQIAIDLKRYKRESTKQRASRITAVRPAFAGTRKEAGSDAHISGSRAGSPGMREWVAWGTAAALLCLLLYFTFASDSDQADLAFPIRSSIIVPDSIYIHSFGGGLGPPVLSPDGRHVAFSGVTPDGIKRIYLRPIGGTETRPLPGTEGGSGPFWSPDGKMLGFLADGRMKKVDLAGGSPTTISSVPNPRGATWSVRGTIVFAPDFQSGLFAVSSEGSEEPYQITTLDSTRQEGSHRWPVFLPDGEHILCTVRAASETGVAEGDAVFLFSLDGKTRKLLVQSSFNPAYADGHLLFVRGSTLLAQKFDLSSLTLSGDPITVLNDVLSDPSYNMAVYTTSASGMLLYQTGKVEGNARPIFLDRSGKMQFMLDDRGEQDQPSFSPDGRQLAMYLYDHRSRRSNIWIADLRTRGIRRLTTNAEGDFDPVWSASGQQIYFSSGAAGRRDVYVHHVAHSGTGKRFFSTSGEDIPQDCSSDGKWVLVESTGYTLRSGDLWLVPVDTTASDPIAFQKTNFDEAGGRISPDNIWVVYTSDESGQDEAYLKRLVSPESDPWKFTSDGAYSPKWGRDGTEVFYINNINQMVRVKLRIGRSGAEVVERGSLFAVPPFTNEFDISPDGRTFVFTRSLELKKFDPMSLVVNWKAMLQ